LYTAIILNNLRKRLTMKNATVFFVFILIFCAMIQENIVSSDQTNKESMLVTTEWLSDHLVDPSIIILHIGKKDEYEEKHIPVAPLFPIRDIFQPPSESLNHEIPPIEQLNDVVRPIGINDDSQIILYYSEDWLSVATRAYLTFDYIGLGEQTSILDGGLTQWVEEDRIITSDIVESQESKITLQINEEVLVDVNWVKENLRNPDVVIIDGRPEEFYDGSEKEDHIAKFGHITGAVSIPFLDITTEDAQYKFKDINNLKKLFLESGAKQGSTIVAYCNTGVWASLVYFTAKYLGYKTYFFDGSFEEWAADDTLPVTEPVKLNN
jgi:thiosulfate/3-mercaptopyruvate sulfurtransferase